MASKDPSGKKKPSSPRKSAASKKGKTSTKKTSSRESKTGGSKVTRKGKATPSSKKSAAKKAPVRKTSRGSGITAKSEARSQTASPDLESYRKGVFDPQEGVGLFSRVFFFSIGGRLEKLARGSLLRALVFTGSVGAGIIFCITFTFADPFLVWSDAGYDEPSSLYGVGLDGKPELIARYVRSDSGREIVELKEEDLKLPVARAFIATEDNNFEEHWGLDLYGIARAAVVNFLAGGIREGASTITQQVARLRYLSRERSIVRKAREASLALFLEARLSKHEILELYFNEVPLGHGTNGVQAASQFYFNKDFRDLNWGEVAVLSSLTTRPNDLSPLKYPSDSAKKIRVVFQRLIETGMITPKDATEAHNYLATEYYPSLFNRYPDENYFGVRTNRFPYATAYVLDQLSSRLRRRIYTGGYKIYSTINVKHQQSAEDQMIPWLKKLNERPRRSPFTRYETFDREAGDFMPLVQALFGLPEYSVKRTQAERDFALELARHWRDEFTMLNLLSGGENVARAFEQELQRSHEGNDDDDKGIQGALISVRPDTGAITAVVGGTGFESRNQLLRFDSAERQPGSSFKPIVYAAGLDYTGRNPGTDRELTASTVLDDSPQHWLSADLSEYSPENYSGSYMGPIRMRPALVQSRNTWAIQAFTYMQPARLLPGIAAITGIAEDQFPRNATLALGSREMTPLQMVRAYAVFASGGYRIDPYLIQRIEDRDGNVIYETDPEQQRKDRILLEATAYIITSLLQDVVQEGTGTAARLYGRPAAGKTGTTDRSTNAWFVGYTPNLVTAIYIGYDRNISLGRSGTGGGMAAPIWGRYMNRALEGEPVMRFPGPPEGVVQATVCETSGKRPLPQCPKTITEYFIRGTVPDEPCDAHSVEGTSPVIMPESTEPVLDEDDF
ncbi:MAG: carboxypeptidase [Leptospiraceae bacterium]|nr:carboxypeptidase [Leptospiraceae bacterium]